MKLTNENVKSIIDLFQREIRENTATVEDYRQYFKFIKKINPKYEQTIEGIVQHYGFTNLNEFVQERNLVYNNKCNVDEFAEFSEREFPILLKIQSAGTIAKCYNSLNKR